MAPWLLTVVGMLKALLFSSLLVSGCTVGATLPFGATSSGGYYPTAGGGGSSSGGGGGAAASDDDDEGGEASYSATVACVHDRAGTDFATAAPLGKGVHGGCVERGPNTDVYVITAPENPGGTFYEIHMASPQQICAEIFNEDREQQGGGECVSDAKIGYYWAALAPGSKLYVRLERTLEKSAPYRLEIKEHLVDDPEEPNNSWKSATPLALGEPHEAMMQMVLNDKKVGADFYKIKVTEAGDLALRVDPGSDDIQAEVLLLDSDRKQIERFNASNAGAILKDKIHVAPGTYYVVVDEDSSVIAPYGISGNGRDKPTSHFYTPYQLQVDLDDGTAPKRGKKTRISRR
jgi:hypothetical protein